MSKILLDLGKLAFSACKEQVKVDLAKNKMSETIRSNEGHEDEVIYIQKECGYWNHQSFLDRPGGILVVTNYRLFYKTTFSTFLMKTGYLSIPLESIEDLEITKYMSITPAIRFRSEGKQYGFATRKADEVLKVIEEARKARIAQKEIQKKVPEIQKKVPEIQKNVSDSLRSNSNIYINNKCSNDIFVAIRFKYGQEWKTGYWYRVPPGKFRILSEKISDEYIYCHAYSLDGRMWGAGSYKETIDGILRGFDVFATGYKSKFTVSYS